MVNDSMGTVLIDEARILKRAEEIGAQITEDYRGEELVLIGILRGAVMWMSDIMKRIDGDVSIDFMAVSSYGAATKSSGIVRINKDLDSDIDGKHVIIVEDIIDSGTTLEYLINYLNAHSPKSIKTCALLDKPGGRRVKLDADYVGFTVDDKFIIGYGLDYDQKYRQLPYISWLNE